MANPHGIPEIFEVHDRGARYAIYCTGCSNAKWSLRKRVDGQIHPGNLLELVDHAARHNFERKVRRVASLVHPAAPVIGGIMAGCVGAGAALAVAFNDEQRILEARANIASITARTVARG